MRPPLATAKDLATLLGISHDSPLLELALERASDAFTGEIGYPLLRETRTRVLRGDGGPDLHLPARHVHTATVTIKGQPPIDVTADQLDGAILLDGTLGILTRADGWPRVPIKVDIDSGYLINQIPGDVRDVVLERAAHIAENLGVYQQESTGSVSASISPAAAGGSTQRWVDTVARYRIRGWS
ncbi:MAG: hypothetical protein Q4G35_03270 [Propionibacteriaceae bacterium]|nr:hypothetical protein [Propionibacteriaceae bacterium]